MLKGDNRKKEINCHTFAKDLAKSGHTASMPCLKFVFYGENFGLRKNNKINIFFKQIQQPIGTLASL